MAKNTKIEVTPEITRQIAMRKAVGTSLRELEAEFGFSRPVINRILGSDLAKGVVKGMTDDAIASAVISVRREMAELTPLIAEALKHHLKEKSLEAVKIVVKGLGMEQAEKQEAQQQSIQVILPHSLPTPKDVPNDIEIQEG